MPKYYISPDIGAGTDLNPYIPRASLYGPWSGIRFGNTGLSICRLEAPSSDPLLYDLGDNLDDPLPSGMRNGIQNRFGISLAETKLRRVLAEMLMVGDGGAKWPLLRPSRDGRYRIYLGELVWELPVIAGGTTITESFNKADSDILGPDLTWTELAGDIDVVSNQARSATLGGFVRARAETDLSSDDHYAQAVVGASEETALARPGVITRKDSSTTLTQYEFRAYFDNDTVLIVRLVGGTATTIGGAWAYTLTAGTTYTIKGSVDGSTLKLYMNGVQQGTDITDTQITGNLRCGLVGFKNTSGYVSWDNFEAGDLIIPKTVTDTLSLADATPGISAKLTLIEALGVVEAFPSGTPKAFLSQADTLALAEALGLKASLSLTEVLALADALSVNTGAVQKLVADALALAETLSLKGFVSLTQGLNLSDALGTTARLTVADALALAETVSPKQFKSIADSLALADQVAAAVLVVRLLVLASLAKEGLEMSGAAGPALTLGAISGRGLQLESTMKGG